MRKHLPFWLLIISLLLVLIISKLIQDGMFLDGIFYSVVSKNMANGIGTFWSPFYSQSGFGGLTGFHEHPPLNFGIQSIFFRFLGNGMYTERIYILVTLIATLLLIVAIWKRVNIVNSEKNISWLPLFFWISTPLVFWSFTNNMQENTMGILILLSVYFYLKSLDPNSNEFVSLLLSGTFIFLASFSKGIPGLFPLSMPILHWISARSISLGKVMYQFAVIFLTITLIYIILFLIPVCNESLSVYLFNRAIYRIGNNPTVDNNFWILYRLFIDIAPALGIFLLLLFIFKRNAAFKMNDRKNSLALFFIFLGIAGVAPMVFTKVQRGFYIVPTIPLFAIGFSLFISGPFSRWCNNFLDGKRHIYFNVLAVVTLCASLIFSLSFIGKTKRDEEMLEDIYKMGPHLRANSIIGVPHEMWNEYSFEGYFLRYFDVSMIEGNKYPYYVSPKNSTQPIPNGFTKIELPTIKYDLYKGQNLK